MDNVYKAILVRPDINKFIIDNLLFAKFTCIETNKVIDLWSPVDHIVYVVIGKKSWHLSGGCCR